MEKQGLFKMAFDMPFEIQPCHIEIVIVVTPSLPVIKFLSSIVRIETTKIGMESQFLLHLPWESTYTKGVFVFGSAVSHSKYPKKNNVLNRQLQTKIMIHIYKHKMQ